MNPFIYAIKHEAVKEKLARLVAWLKRVGAGPAVTDAPGNISNDRNIADGTRRAHKGTAHR